MNIYDLHNNPEQLLYSDEGSISSVGHKYWRKNGKLHRDGDKPAVIDPEGTKAWYKNGELHREDGPAIVMNDGFKIWYQNDLRHREDGPAVMRPNNDVNYYLKGLYYSKSEWGIQ